MKTEKQVPFQSRILSDFQMAYLMSVYRDDPVVGTELLILNGLMPREKPNEIKKDKNSDGQTKA